LQQSSPGVETATAGAGSGWRRKLQNCLLAALQIDAYRQQSAMSCLTFVSSISDIAGARVLLLTINEPCFAGSEAKPQQFDLASIRGNLLLYETLQRWT
jgi:hypothetical protein